MRSILIIFLAVSIWACGSDPKVVQSTPTTEGGSAVDQALNPHQKDADDFHTVEVKEVLQANRYTYLLVNEGEEDFWIAIPKQEVEVGETVRYTGGVLKKNLVSKDFNRVFETVYLVSGIMRKTDSGSAVDQALDQMQSSQTIDPDKIQVNPPAGGITLSELTSNPKKYAGKTVTVAGQVVKVNPHIMDRNWIHIRDGSGDNPDLTVTTMENIPVGHVVTFEGVITLDKDFGAGYRYDIIMEDAVAIKN